MTITKDWMDKNTYHVLAGASPLGYIEQFAPKEWKAFSATGEFKGWFTSKKAAALAC